MKRHYYGKKKNHYWYNLVNFVYFSVKSPNSSTNRGTLFHKCQSCDCSPCSSKTNKDETTHVFLPCSPAVTCARHRHLQPGLLPRFPHWSLQIPTGPSKNWPVYFECFFQYTCLTTSFSLACNISIVPYSDPKTFVKGHKFQVWPYLSMRLHIQS